MQESEARLAWMAGRLGALAAAGLELLASAVHALCDTVADTDAIPTVMPRRRCRCRRSRRRRRVAELAAAVAPPVIADNVDIVDGAAFFPPAFAG